MSDEPRERTTGSGIPIEPVYRPENVPDFDPRSELGEPGTFPFVRGVYPDMYRGKPWTMRQYAGYATARESNARYRYLLEHGQTGLSVAFDLPTQMGYDSDDPMANGEVGRTGVPIDTVADMELLLDGIDLGEVSTSMTINATAELPAWNTISISGYHMREAGSTAVQEVAFTVANAIAYAEAAQSAGLAFDDFAPRLSFFFAAHNDLLEEVAKFRAARRVWATVARDRFGSRDPRSMAMRFHVQTGGSTLTAQQPEVNAVRTTVQGLAAVLGGAQSLHTNALDEALGLPTPSTARLALRTQQVLASESGLTATVDPLGGSYYVESLTNALEARIDEELARIDEMGGTLEALRA